MVFFARAVVTGFALSLGGAIFKKVAPKLGLADKDKEKEKETETIAKQEGVTDPNQDV